GVAELVDAERVAVGDPAAAQVAADRIEADVVVVAAAEGMVEAVEQEIETEDFEGRQCVVLALLALGRKTGDGRARGRRFVLRDPKRLRRSDECRFCGARGASHASGQAGDGPGERAGGGDERHRTQYPGRAP